MFFALTSSTWDGLSDGVAILIIVMLLLIGLFLGYAMRGLVGRWKVESIEKKIRLREEETESEVKARLKEADISARAEVLKAKEEFERSTKARRNELQQIEERLTQREAGLDNKARNLDDRDAMLRTRLAEVAASEKASSEKSARAESRLQELAGMTHDEARREILRRANAELRADGAILSRRIQEAAREQGETRAARILADVVQRCAVGSLNELATCTVPLPNQEMKGRIVGRDGRNVRAFTAVTGVNLLLDDTPDCVVLSSFDPVRREIARRALARLIADGRIHPASIESAVAAARQEIESSSGEVGGAAAAEAGVQGLADDVLAQMGALAYRTSFSQNVLAHSVEVAFLAGAIAAELHLDAALARRIGFLHDIGKAVTGEKRGAHAEIGADFLRLHGERDIVCESVAAHHSEAGSDVGVYAVICAAADAISSARPGARQENLADYVQRLSDVEKIASAHDGVVGVFAVQAGRDLRVIVDPEKVSDGDASILAGEICRDISAHVKFPGMIRVTVIREMRCTEYAR